MNSSLTTKFRAIYIALIFACFFINAITAHIFYTYEVRNGISGLASQTVETVSENVENSLKTIAKSSTYILGTSDVQNYLTGKPASRNAIFVRNLRNALYLDLENMPLVSSIMIINEDGSFDGAARYSYPEKAADRPAETEWHKEVCEKKGKIVYCVNSGGFFKFEEGKNYISLIRMINSTEDASPLGYMIINIAVDDLLSFARTTDNSYSDICVYLSDHVLLGFLNDGLNVWISHHPLRNLSGREDVKIGDERYLLLKIDENEQDWHYLSAIKYNSFADKKQLILTIFFSTVVISLLLFLLIALCISRFITTPLNKLMKAMKKTENGEFKSAYVTSHKDEIGQLQDEYNEMVQKISQLLTQKIDEQKLLRKAELNTLQEQIKPHFLYNSLSGIGYLINSRQNDRAYDMILSLSEYYRESLSKGSEIVSFKTEINIVKNYLKLQKMRFPDMFDDVYEISEQVWEYKIPRLILQPLVENALHHGIIPMAEGGIIKIQAYAEEENFVITVSDDGVGMEKEKMQEILSGNLEMNQRSFGLRGTIERLHIFYETDQIYHIESAPGEGTKITLTIPKNRIEEKI
ncbi:MAG: sensor histidine kinase [Eubacteriales bacterium]|nr:sensor histidine kinase [Eubacteriales bacterium]